MAAPQAGSTPFACLAAAGETGRLVESYDWGSTPLGSIGGWPQSLATVVGLVLGSPVPLVLLWGEDGITIYNDAYSVLAGTSHASSLGRKVGEGWPELAALHDDALKAGLSGRTLSYKGQELTLFRDGRRERVCLNLDYSPVAGEDGRPAGVLAFVVETSGRAASERPEQDGRELLGRNEANLRFLDRLAEATWRVTDGAQVMAAAARVLGEHLGVAVCAYADMESDEDGFTILGDWTAPGAASIVGTYSLAAFGEVAVRELRAGRPFVTRDTVSELGPEQAATFLKLGLKATVCMPLVKDSRLRALMAVHGDAPRDWTDGDIALIAETAERCWAHIERTRSEAALRRRSSQLQELAQVATAVALAPTLERTLEELTTAARRIIGAHQGVVSLTRGPDWSQAINTVALTRKYDAWRAYSVMPDGSGIYAWLCEENRPARFTQAELEAHPRWRGFGSHAGAHPPMRGWLAAPLVGRDGRNLGLIQLSDKEEGAEFDEADEAMLVQLAQIASAAVEQSQTETALRKSESQLRDLNATLERRVADRTTELAESQRRFRAIFNSALQFMALLTPSGSVVEVNDTALDWSQIEPEDIVGRPFWLAAPMRGNPELQAAIESGIRRAAAGETVRAEYEMRGPGEVRATVDFSLKPVSGERGEAIWLVAEGRDMTELKRAQEALRQAQKLEAIGQLTGGVAHDFNNLLTVIKSSTDLLRRPDLAEERRRRYVDAISDTVDRASKLTGQLLAFARRQALKPEVFDPVQRVRSIAEMLRTIVGSRIEVAIEAGCQLCLVEADASQFETALVNMAVNARDAMDGEGRLTIRVDASAGSSLVHAGKWSRLVAVSIGDTGCGIPADRHGEIFEPFYTTKGVGKGTGLGLSQVFGFAKQSGGDVAVESEIGRGTTFTLYLPRFEGAAPQVDAADQQRASSAEEEGRGRRVLVVEDNVEVGKFSTQILQDLGYATTWAANADEALRLLAGPDGFDAVFSDVVMPGSSGVELGQEIRRRYPGLPVVLTSGYSHVLAEEGRHGFELVTKPYAAEQLSRVLRRAISRSH